MYPLLLALALFLLLKFMLSGIIPKLNYSYKCRLYFLNQSIQSYKDIVISLYIIHFNVI